MSWLIFFPFRSHGNLCWIFCLITKSDVHDWNCWSSSAKYWCSTGVCPRNGLWCTCKHSSWRNLHQGRYSILRILQARRSYKGGLGWWMVPYWCVSLIDCPYCCSVKFWHFDHSFYGVHFQQYHGQEHSGFQSCSSTKMFYFVPSKAEIWHISIFCLQVTLVSGNLMEVWRS